MRPYYDDGQVQIYHGDCRDVLPVLGPCDLLLTDPPYGIPRGASFWRRNGTAIEEHGESGFNVLVEGWRRLVVGGQGAYWCEFTRGFKTVAKIYADLEPLEWEPWREFVWYKPAPAPTPRSTFMSAFEVAAIAFRPKRVWFGGQHPDAWSGLSPNRLNRGCHPSQKPEGLIGRLVAALSCPGALILDPFVGSGTTLLVAKNLNRRAVGIEIEERYCEIAAERLSQEVLPLAVPS